MVRTPHSVSSKTYKLRNEFATNKIWDDLNWVDKCLPLLIM